MPYSKIILDTKQIEQIVCRLSNEISNSLSENDNLLVLVVLDGAKYFAHDLLKKLNVPMEVEYIKASSYSGTRSSGKVTLREDAALINKICDRHVLLVDDVYDTGLTLSHILEWLNTCQAKSINTCVLLEKDIPHTIDITIDFLGTKVENEFLIGYGLDHNEQYRELPFIGVLSDEIITRENPACTS